MNKHGLTMKELSIEQIAKVYDANHNTYIELVNRLEDVKNAIKKQNYGIAMDILCKPYPKFQIITSTKPKNYKDERIRSMLIKFFGNGAFFDSSTNGIPDKDIIAWLEKQGKVPVTINIDKMVEDYANNEDCDNEGFGKPVNCMIRAYRQGLTDAIATVMLEKQGEQKPSWSEEDSPYYDDICEILRNLILIETDKINKDFVQKDLDWLMSIKQRIETK